MQTSILIEDGVLIGWEIIGDDAADGMAMLMDSLTSSSSLRADEGGVTPANGEISPILVNRGQTERTAELASVMFGFPTNFATDELGPCDNELHVAAKAVFYTGLAVFAAVGACESPAWAWLACGKAVGIAEGAAFAATFAIGLYRDCVRDNQMALRAFPDEFHI